MNHTKEPWETTGLKPEWEFIDGVRASDEGMTINPAYFYHEPIETPQEQSARKYGYRLNTKKGEYVSLWGGKTTVIKSAMEKHPDFVDSPPDEVAVTYVRGTQMMFDKDNKPLMLDNNFDSVFCEGCGKPRYLWEIHSSECPVCKSVMYPVLKLEGHPYYIKSCEINSDGNWDAVFKYAGYPEDGIDDTHCYMTAFMYMKDFYSKAPIRMTDEELEVTK